MKSLLRLLMGQTQTVRPREHGGQTVPRRTGRTFRSARHRLRHPRFDLLESRLLLTGTLGVELTSDLSAARHGATIHYGYAIRFTPDSAGPRAVAGSSLFLDDDTCLSVNPVLNKGLNVGDSDADGNLDAGETWTYTCALTVPAHNDAEFNPVVNSVVVIGDDLRGDPVLDAADTASVDIVHDQGTLRIIQSADVSSAIHGSSVTYRFALSYRAADGVPALGVIVSDPICDVDPAFISGDVDQDGQLDVTETWIFQCAHAVPPHSDTEGDPMLSVATASGFNFDLAELAAASSNSVSVDIVHGRGSLMVLQSANVSSMTHGGSVTYNFEVRYNSADRLPATGVQVSDLACDAAPILLSGDLNRDRRLDGSETWIFQCKHAVPGHSDNEADRIVSVATASGFSSDGTTLADVTSNAVSLPIVHAAGSLTVAQSADVSSVAHGGSVVYTFSVTYTPGADSSPAQKVVVTDSNCAAAPAFVVGDMNSNRLLNAGETWTYTCSHAVPASHSAAEADPIESAATVSGQDLDGDPVTGGTSNLVSVDIVHGTIRGRSFLDSDGDAAQDADEAALVGWTVKLFRDANGNGVFDAGRDFEVGSRATDAGGGYSFGDLAPGTYLLREMVQLGFVRTTPERSVAISGGEVAAGLDFGNQAPAVSLITDPWDSSKTALLVMGTVGNDKISFAPGPKAGSKSKKASGASSTAQPPDTVALSVNGLGRGTFSPTGHIIAYGQGGDDSIDVAKGVSLPAVLHGGDGDDLLGGGPGHDVLLGDAGNDQLNGQKGNDLLIGGAGVDRLVGGDGNDILIAGHTDFDTRDAALAAIMAQWSPTSTRDYASRVRTLRGDSLGPGGVNGPFLLNPSTVHDDGIADMLTGSAGQDWFQVRQLGPTRDILTGRLATEVADAI